MDRCYDIIPHALIPPSWAQGDKVELYTDGVSCSEGQEDSGVGVLLFSLGDP